MKTIIVFASMTGNTEWIADSIANELRRNGDHVEIKDAFDAYAEELTSYDRILVGSYTWGDGDLPDEMLGFFEDLQKTDLTGKLAAAFGSGDSFYDSFAGAVDLLEETLKEQGCEIVTKGLKVDQESEERMEALCQSFAKEFVHASQVNDIV